MDDDRTSQPGSNGPVVTGQSFDDFNRPDRLNPLRSAASDASEPTLSPALAARLNESQLQERRAALRAILRSPLLGAEGAAAEQFGLVRRHAAWLREWLAANTGWRIDITAEYARLRKVPAELGDATRPARDPTSGQPFSRRRYVLLCLVLAMLERADRQTTLGRLAESVSTLASSDKLLQQTGMNFDFRTSHERRDLVHAVRLLVELRVLIQQDGDEQTFLTSSGDVLYGIRRAGLATLLCATRGPSTIELDAFEDRLRLLTAQVSPESDEARNQAIRWSITRRLLDDPVVYRDDFATDERAYFETQRPAIARRIEEATGLTAEVRAEGIAMVDDHGDLTDLAIPDEGTDGHVTLLVAEHLARAAKQRDSSAVPLASVAAHIAGERTAYGAYWRRDAREEGSETTLARDAVDRLCALGLARTVPGGVVPLPAIGRYGLDDPRQAASGAAMMSS